MTFFRTKLAAAAIALAAAVPAIPADELPDLGNVAQSVLSPQQERRIGDEIMRQIRADRDYLDDAEVSEYLNSLGFRLVSSSPEPRLGFEFFAVNDPMVNAFALPGGYIGVHTGLLLTAQSESELAAVLAHEVAHVTQNHLARIIESEKRSQITSLAALAIAILAARSNSQVSQAAVATAQALPLQSRLDFTREHEREADRIGLQILERSGFDPRAMVAFFERLQRANRLYETNAPSYLRTHPLTFERIADVQNRTDPLPYRQAADSADFHLLRAKLRARQGSPADAVTYFESTLREKKFASEGAQRYGLVAALLRTGNVVRAERELEILRKSAPAHPVIETLAGQVLLAAGQTAGALAHYPAARQRFPQHRALTYDYADALIRDRQPELALKLLAGEVERFPDDPHLHGLRARSYAALGKRLLQHQAQAEAYTRLGNLGAAIEQLQLALKSGDGDFYQLSSAEARLRELKQIDAENRRP
ncbi:MAG: M48 family metallopeptidase [Betaproteobacteria bacterium]|nr:M48 family metallopeptidase [Betaproteobacteria bacterium]